MTQFPPIDPSKMDPKLLMELTEMVRRLPPAQVQRMQTLMHNMMAGFDVTREMEEFEKELPPGFREKLFSLMASQPSPAPSAPIEAPTQVCGEVSGPEMDLRQARLTVLRGVAQGTISPEEAEKLLFNA